VTQGIDVAAVVGPTAVGKSSIGLEVAEALDAEIVSVDSMQAYRGMDVGTDKPTPEMQARVPHHLLDAFPPSHDLTVSEFQSRARAAIADIAAGGRLPLLVGGSGLYFRAVVDDLRFPPRSPDVRRELEEEAEAKGSEALHARLARLDPKAAEKIEIANTRRTVRALEVIALTGRPFSENDSWETYESIYNLAVAGLGRHRAMLYDRIERRVSDILRGGLVDEVRRLEGVGMSRAASQALGYRQALKAGAGAPEVSLREEIAAATKRFARRQESWFRADPRVVWFDASQPGIAEALTSFFEDRFSLR
jgi:tRNA dimethylallyltransferase